MSDVNDVLDLLQELQEDTSVSKNVKLKIQCMQKELRDASEGDFSLVVNKILSDLEELSGDVNLPMFVRTQIWSITSLLEYLS